MTIVRILPSVARGTVRAPGSKSYTHRALVAAHLCGRRYTIIRPLDADDTRRTAGAIAALGSPVRFGAGRWTITPARSHRPRAARRIHCGESGTTLRFATALAALGDRPVLLTGSGRLGERPMESLVRTLTDLGATICSPVRGRSLPLTVQGPIHGGRAVVDASESSQFTSALLLALPTLTHGSTLTQRGPVVSAPYVDATLSILAAHGIRVRRGPHGFRIPGQQEYRGDRFEVPGDASSAAYLWAAAAVSGGTATVAGVPADRPQADLAVLEILRMLGAQVEHSARGVTVRGGPRRPFRVRLTGSPDLYPLAGALAAATDGESRLLGAPQVVAKESNRRVETARLARAMGATVRSIPGGLAIRGRRSPRAFSLRGAFDHRVVMSASVGALACDGPSSVADGRCVAKSFPGFFEVLGDLIGPERVR